ncbi:MAG: OmpH family outer membrane protein [Candidatus Methylomirabilales bacterium]
MRMRRGMSKGLPLLVLITLFFGVDGAPVGAEAVKIGLVDLQKVLVESKKGREPLTKLKADMDAKNRDLDVQEQKIRQMVADLEKQQGVLSEAARKDKEKAIQKAKVDLNRIAEDLNREFGERERDVRQRLVREVTTVVQDYGKKNGYVLIIEVRAAGVMYSSEGADISKEIIAAYDGGGGSQKQ